MIKCFRAHARRQNSSKEPSPQPKSKNILSKLGERWSMLSVIKFLRRRTKLICNWWKCLILKKNMSSQWNFTRNMRKISRIISRIWKISKKSQWTLKDYRWRMSWEERSKFLKNCLGKNESYSMIIYHYYFIKIAINTSFQLWFKSPRVIF